MAKTKDSMTKAAQVRKLLSEGKTPAEVAQLAGVKVQQVYNTRHYDNRKARLELTAQAKADAKRPVGRPKGSKTKRAVPMQLIDKTVLRDMQAELSALRTENARLCAEAVKICPPPVYVEVPVPQPFSHYTFWQRLRILFLGSAA